MYTFNHTDSKMFIYSPGTFCTEQSEVLVLHQLTTAILSFPFLSWFQKLGVGHVMASINLGHMTWATVSWTITLTVE